jgi:hypothetical protein
VTRDHAIATLDTLQENDYAGTMTHPDAAGVVARIDLEVGPVVTLYSTGRALIQGRQLDKHRANVRELLLVEGWKVS